MTEAAWRRRFRATRISLPRWARDDPRHLLYTSNASGKWELYAWDLATDAHRQMTDRPEGTTLGELDPSGTTLWWFDDERGNELGRWMVQPFAGGPPRPAAPALPPAYSAGLGLAGAFAVVGSSTDDGTRVHVVRGTEEPFLLYAHRQDASVEGIARDETLVCLSHSEHGDSRHPALRVVDPGGRSVGDLWDGPERGLWSAGWSPVPGEGRLLVQHERQDQRRALIWDLATGSTRDLPIDLPGDIDAAWYPDGASILLVHDHRGRSELYRYDLEREALKPIPVETGAIAEARVYPSPSGPPEVWYAWSRSSTPPTIRADGRILLQPPAEPAPGGVAYTDHVVADVPCFVAEPAGPRPHPTIFMIHGGPHYHDADGLAPRVQAWVDHGYAAVLVNYRGSTGYGRAWRDALEGNPGLTELEDVAKVHDWVVGTGLADPRRVVLSGGSWGGYITLLGLGTQPERWSLGIGIVPVADYVAAYEDEMEPLRAFDRALFGGTPEDSPESYRQRSPLTYVERVRVPVLILAGENDPRCPIRQIDNYLARLRELGKPHEVYRFQAGHGSLRIEETIRQTEVQIAFAAKYLGTPMPM
jgi:dipeptidyl aminopeptidase/acylaminoacyl peptidase